MIQELISMVFGTRNHAHLQHWAEDSGFKHTVLGEFYEEVISVLDDFVEAYQGNHGQLEVFELEPYKFEKTILDCIERDILWMEKYREDLCEGIGALENLYDTIVDTYLSTRYKLKSFK